MSDDLTPNRPDNLTPEAQKPKPVHPLARKPAPEEATQAEAPKRYVNVVFTYPRAPKPYLTWALIAINVIIFALTSNRLTIRDMVVVDFANQPMAVLQNGEYWRLFTSMFLHVNLPHVLMNMLALYGLGQRLEITFGHVRYGLIYLLSGFSASILSAIFQPMQGYAIGASGAVFGIFAAEAAFLLVNQNVLDANNGDAARQRLRSVLLFAGMYLLIGFIGDWTGGGLMNMDNWAHIGGFVGGGLLTYLICPRYVITVNAEKNRVTIGDLRPFKTRIAITIYYAAGLLGLLLLAVLIR